MAKKSKIARYHRQLKLIGQYADLRRELKEKGEYEALRKLPRDSNPNRLKNRDRTDGRPHAYMRKFGLSRITFRKLAHKGQLPGVKKGQLVKSILLTVKYTEIVLPTNVAYQFLFFKEKVLKALILLNLREGNSKNLSFLLYLSKNGGLYGFRTYSQKY